MHGLHIVCMHIVCMHIVWMHIVCMASKSTCAVLQSKRPHFGKSVIFAYFVHRVLCSSKVFTGTYK